MVLMDDHVDIGGIVFVIFGCTGDLTKRKLIPALYELLFDNQLPNNFHVIGFARRDWDDSHFEDVFRDAVKQYDNQHSTDEDLLEILLSHTHYISSTFSDQDGYEKLNQLIQQIGVKNIIFYLATPPSSYVEIIQNIGSSNLLKNRDGWTRIVIEKPHGVDLKSSQNLEMEAHKIFDETQIFRIDHYLGKETVQNILVLRFANGIFEPLWNRRYVDHVQITVAESVGIGSRAGYFENTGIIRDMFQNHLLQLLTLTAMEAPVAFKADAVRDEKVKVLKALRPFNQYKDAIDNTFRAQYVSGSIGNQRVPGYKDEGEAPTDSVTETLFAIRLFIDNWRWAGVPFYIRSGKRLPCRATEIIIQFKQVPLSLFNWYNMAGQAPNTLVLNLQPNEGIRLTFGAKEPGPINRISPVEMQFCYKDAFGIEPPEAYKRLLLDCLIGDATLFTRSDEVAAQWTFTNRILEAWQEHPIRNLPVYEAGTWGPPGIDEFIQADKREWYNPTQSHQPVCD